MHNANMNASPRPQDPVYAYSNGRLLKDGRPTTPDETASYDRTNPYKPENWLATPADRGSRTPGAMPVVLELPARNPEITRPVDPRFAAQSPAMATYLTELLKAINPLFLTQSGQATPTSTSAASLSAPMNTTNTAPLRNLLPGLSSKFGRARQA